MKKLRALLVVFATTAVCFAGGPRFVTGTNFTGASMGKRIAWYTPNVTYFTDPGDLNANVPHAQADAMVSAAAAVWNNPYALLTLAQGGALAEHVSDQNAYLNGTSMVWPADVMASNYLSKPIAVIYDIDGSVTDMLLGSGASDPEACRHNAVTESVDSFGQTGTIQHALLILNGRCVGSAPEQLTQMQYQLERAFGRVLGLAWSQCNDNVFTAVSTVTAAQQANWPIMHPIDVICGDYTYQCMRYPFQLRVDDISALGLLYPVTAANIVPGKSLTIDANSMSVDASVYFSNVTSMEDVNVVVLWGILGVSSPSYESASGVTGATFERMASTVVTGVVPALENMGSYMTGSEGLASMGRLPLNFSNNRANTVTLVGEPINPLYSGEYAVGIYKGTPLALASGTSTIGGTISVGNSDFNTYVFAKGEPSACAPGNDGTLAAPVAADASGWWTGQLCEVGHLSIFSQTIRAGRTYTVEVTALDETGAPTVHKLRPVIGLWKTSDATNIVPTLASAVTPMNSMSVGMTQLVGSAFTANQPVRMVIADAYGAGRNDFAYKARLLYADSISPASVGRGGGVITITGMGFRPGNQVLVNGIVATVTSWTGTQIVATVPTLSAANAAVGTAVAVTVSDTSTGGTTTISSALVYTSAANSIVLVSAPSALETGVTAAVPFAVKVIGPDGKTAVSGASVQLAVAGGASMAVCGSVSACVVVSDANGLVTTTLTGVAAGGVRVTATEMSAGANVSATMQDVDPVRAMTTNAVTHYLATGASSAWPMTVVATQDGSSAGGVAMMWSAAGGATVSGAQTMTDASGTASATVRVASIAGGSLAGVTACAWSTTCAAMQVLSVAQPQWTIAVSGGAGQSVKAGVALAAVTMKLSDGAGHPLEGATVQVYQTDDAWQSACPSRGACPVAPVMGKSTVTLTSDANGNISVTPLVTGTIPQIVNIAASTGTQGFVTLTLDVTP